MTRIGVLALAATVTLAASTALASPQIPNPTNPYPDEPVATDGSPLPRQRFQEVRRPDAFNDFNAFFGARRPSRPTQR